MAHDKTLQLEVRIWYETHDWSVEKVAEYFELNPKTVGHWKWEQEWEKNKYKGDKELARKLVTESVMKTVKDGVIAELADNVAATDGAMMPDKKHLLIASALVEQHISLDGIHKRMGKAVGAADAFLPHVKSMGEIRTYTEVMKNVKEITYGKDPDTLIKINNIGNLTAEEIASKSTDELLKIARETKDEQTA